MAINFPGPYELRIFYTVSGPRGPKTHVQRNNIQVVGSPDPGEVSFADVDVELRDNTTATLEAITDEWVGLLLARYPDEAAAVFTQAELWRYEPGTFLATYIAAYDLSLDGVSTASSVVASQEIYTFRTQEGGIMKVSLMETVQAAGSELVYSALAAGQQAIVTFILDSDSPFLARDTSFPIAFLKMFPGQNEATFKWRYRSG